MDTKNFCNIIISSYQYYDIIPLYMDVRVLEVKTNKSMSGHGLAKEFKIKWK